MAVAWLSCSALEDDDWVLGHGRMTHRLGYVLLANDETYRFDIGAVRVYKPAPTSPITLHSRTWARQYLWHEPTSKWWCRDIQLPVLEEPLDPTWASLIKEFVLGLVRSLP